MRHILLVNFTFSLAARTTLVPCSWHRKIFKMNFVAFGLMVLCCSAMAVDLPLGIPGPAPDFPQMDSFDGDKAQGKWYGHYYANNGLPPLPIHCWSFIGTPGDAGKITAAVTLFAPLELEVDMTIHVTPVEGTSATFIMEELTKGPLTTSMVVPMTDYETYFVKIDIFLVQTVAGPIHAYSLNVYSRTPEMDDATVKYVKTQLQNMGITDELTYVPQDCPAASLQDTIMAMLPQ